MNAKECYLKGDYEKASTDKNQVKSMPYKIGGLVFVGKHQEARLLFKGFKDKLSNEGLAVANFHMGLSYTRTSEYQKGREYFIENLRFTKNKSSTLEAQFFAFQGGSFYRFFFSKHLKSQRFAERAYSYLLQMSSPPGLLLGLSLDIQAHNKVQLGAVNQGFKLFEEALKVTKENRLIDLHSEIEISYIVYKSEFDTDLKKNLDTLSSYLKKSKNKNDYSKSEIILQIAKTYLLSGQFQTANDFLNSNFDIIYKNQNKRKVATLNSLLAQLSLYKGQYLEALSIVSVALSQLDQEVDRSLYLPLLGIKIRALDFLKKDNSEEIKESAEIVKRIDRTINQNIQNRLTGEILNRKIGDDKVGDLLDKVKKKAPDALKQILENGFLSCIYNLYNLDPDKKYILVIESLETVILVDERGVTNTEKFITKLQLNILNNLQEKPQSKEDLIEKIWGYEYDSLRHDSLIYTSIARLRKILEPNENWIYSDENLYSLNSNVVLLSPESSVRKAPSYEKEKIEIEGLNYRQLQLLSKRDHMPFSVSEYGKKWSVTRMTALRDCKLMVDKGLLKKIGQGKATRYMLNL